MMLYEIMRTIKNFFLTGEVYIDTFVIEDGVVSLPFLNNGDYYLVQGSRYNDGVHKYNVDTLKDESFNGEIAVLAPPSDFLELVDEIKAYNDKVAQTGVYASESFGGYSYTLATNASGNKASWRDAYRSRLNAYRKA